MRHSYAIDEFLDMSQEHWSHWYLEYSDFFQFVADELTAALNGFRRQLGHDPLLLLSVRKKTEQSFVDKIAKVRHAEAKKARKEGRKVISIFDMFQDIVGARMVFYFSDDQIIPMRYFSHYGLFNVDSIEVYDIFSNEHPLRKQDLFDTIDQLFPEKTRFESKKSSYESIHMSVRFSPEHLKIQLESGLHRTSSVGVLGDARQAAEKRSERLQKFSKWIEEFPVEIQIRTLLQHNWAQIEHRLRYGEKKSSKLFSKKGSNHGTDDHINDMWVTLSMILSTAERTQRILVRHHNDMLKKSAFSRKRPPFDIGRREAIFYDGEELACGIIKEVTAEYEAVTSFGGDHGEEKHSRIAKLLDLIDEAERQCGMDILVLLIDVNMAQWLRQRLFLLMIGHLLICGDQQTSCATINWMQQKSRNRKASPFPNDTTLSAAKIYDHIRFVDARHRYETKDNVFCDPLVNYRSAEVYASQGDFGRAIYILKEALAEGYIEKFNDTSNADILNRAHFSRKISEYYWITYLSDPSREYELIAQACEVALRELCSVHPKLKPGTERINLLSNYIIFSFDRTIMRRRSTDSKRPFLEIIKKLDPADIKLLNTPPANLQDGKTRHAFAAGILHHFEGDTAASIALFEKAWTSLNEKDRIPEIIQFASEVAEYFNFKVDPSPPSPRGGDGWG